MENRIKETEKKVFGDSEKAFADPAHPGFHLTAPSHFTIDFWGPIIHKDFYHIMYHVCPERGAFQENTYFFHSRSKNLIDWEMLPCPIAPDDNEIRLNDGCICLNGKGQPVMLYTSCPKEHIPRTHCAAIGDDDLLTFKRVNENPFMTLENHGGPEFGWGWSDPYVFETNGRTFMLMSKCVTSDGKEPLPIYEATDDTMLHWEYKGIFFDTNGEVVNFFPLGSKWVLIYSPYNTIEYFVGDFDTNTLRFTAENKGILSYGYHSQENPLDRGFYASYVYNEPNRKVLGGWISGFKENDLWDGCMSIPRELGLNEKKEITQKVIPEFDTLKGETINQTDEIKGCAEFRLNCDMLDIELNYRGNITLEINNTALAINICENGFAVNGEFYSCGLKESEHLQVLIDKSVAEIFIGDGSVCATRCFEYIGKNPKIKVTAEDLITDFKCIKINPCRLTKTL